MTNKCSQCLRFTKRTTLFVLSNMGMILGVVAYALLGAVLFGQLESTNETSKKDSVLKIKCSYAAHMFEVLNRTQSSTELKDFIYTTAENSSGSSVVHSEYRSSLTAQQQAMYDSIMTSFTGFQKEFLEKSQTSGYDGTQDREVHQWTFTGSLLFAISVITTIGYGDIVPRTSQGKIFTILYAIVGVPLTLLCLSNLGSYLGYFFTNGWYYLVNLWVNVKCWGEKNKQFIKPKKGDAKKRRMLRKIDAAAAAQIEEEEGAIVRVPVVVCLGWLALYILIGAIVFSEWEDWTFVTGAYFCFITLSTIGFGDYVPGKDTADIDVSKAATSGGNICRRDGFDSLPAQADAIEAGTGILGNMLRQVVCIFYVLIGLALVATVFELIVDSIMDSWSKLMKRLMPVDANAEAKIESVKE